MDTPARETYSPETLDEVAALLLAADGGVHPVVMGTTLLVEANETTGSVSIAVDLTRVPELNRLEYEERNGLLLGAAVPLTDALRFSPMQQAYAILADGLCRARPDEGGIGQTLGGCLDTLGPSPDLALPLICLGASVAIFGPHGWSEMSVEALCARWPGMTLQQGEFVVGVRLPAPAARSGGAYVRSAPSEGAPGAFAAGAFLVMEDDLTTCCGARVAVWIEAVRPLRAVDAERFLQGRRLEHSAVEQAGQCVTDGAWLPGVTGAEDDRGRILRQVAREAIQCALDRTRPHPPSLEAGGS